MKAWHFSREDNRLQHGDGRLIEIGVTHSVEGEPVLCQHGLHGSTRIIDALKYAPGPNLWLVDITGNIQKDEDKICGLHRTPLAFYPCADLLHEFARKCALRNIEKIKKYTDRYHLIVDYLESGRDDIRAATSLAAWEAISTAAAEQQNQLEEGKATWAAMAARAATVDTGGHFLLHGAQQSAAWAAWAGARAAWSSSPEAWEAARAAEREWQEKTIQTMIKERFPMQHDNPAVEKELAALDEWKPYLPRASWPAIDAAIERIRGSQKELEQLQMDVSWWKSQRSK